MGIFVYQKHNNVDIDSYCILQNFATHRLLLKFQVHGNEMLFIDKWLKPEVQATIDTFIIHDVLILSL